MKEALTPRVKSTAKTFWGIYLGLAGLEALLLVGAGLPVYDSLCTSFSSISTAGFSPRAYSIAEYNSILVEAIICIFLLLGGTNFIIYHQIVLKKNINYLDQRCGVQILYLYNDYFYYYIDDSLGKYREASSLSFAHPYFRLSPP